MNSPEDPMAPSGEGFHTPIGGRRRFFQWITAIIAGTIGLGLSVPLVGYVVSPALKRRTQLWVDIGGVNELDTGQPKQLLHATTVQDGYMETKAIKSVWAVKEPTGEITAKVLPHVEKDLAVSNEYSRDIEVLEAAVSRSGGPNLAVNRACARGSWLLRREEYSTLTSGEFFTAISNQATFCSTGMSNH